MAAVEQLPPVRKGRKAGRVQAREEREQVRERLSRTGGGLHEHIQALDDDRAQNAFLYGGEVRDPRVAQTRLGALTSFFVQG